MLPLFENLIRKGSKPARAVYVQAVTHARLPGFYRTFGVPDSVDGRFEMIVLHIILLLHRLQGEGEDAERFSRALIEALIDDMDRSLREMGVGDLSVGKKVKQMAAAFYGHASAYDAALAESADAAALSDALMRNVFGTSDPSPDGLAGLCVYVRTCVGHLALLESGDIVAGELSLPVVE